MANTTKKKPTTKTKKLTAEEKAEQALEKYWDQAEARSQEIINSLFDTNLPFNFPYNALDLEKSVDWRTIARYDIPNFYQDEEELPSVEYLAEEIAYHYLLTVLKRFIDDLSEYDCHDPAYFENLINYEN